MAHAKRVLIAGIYHETHTFVPGRTALADFAVLRGQALWDAIGEPSPLGGVMEFAREQGWEVVPAVDYRAFPSGTVEDAALEVWWREFADAAQAALQAGPLDGIYLVLHGAMVTETCRDVEGELLERIRSIPELTEVPLAGVTDLHANVSPRMARYSSALVTYRRNPHTDAKERAKQAAQILDTLMAEGRSARTLWKQPPLILAPTHTGTDDEPMRTLEAMARWMEAETPELLAVNVHAGFAFADTENTGVSFTISTVGDEAAAERLLDALCQAALQTPVHGPMDELPLEEAMTRLKACDSGPILLIEPSDNIGAGAPGEGIALLRALIAHDIHEAGVVINDPQTVAALADLPPGERRGVQIGGKSSPLYGGGCELEVEMVSCSEGRFTLEDPNSHMASMLGSQIDMGPCAVVRHGGVLILLTSRATAPFDLGQWRSQGIDPERLFAIGVKAAVAHRRAYDPIARTSLYVRTPGPCSSDLNAYPFRHLRRPIRPLDPLPVSLHTIAALPSGEPITLRSLQPDDAARFGEYLIGLSEETRSRYGPHPFDQATADAICATLDPTDILRMVATISCSGKERIIAYILLRMGVLTKDRERYEKLGIALAPDTDCTLAPSVADDFQNRGVGSILMRHLLQIAPTLGRKRVVLWGGVQARNDRAIHFYTKWGFRKVGEFFTDKNNFDMILTLPSKT